MPKQNQLHVDKLLSNVSVQYNNEEYIAQEVFPTVTVNKNSDLYRVYERDWRIPETARAVGAEAREADFEFSNSSYRLKIHALKELVPDDDARNNDMGDLRTDTVEYLTDRILSRIELDTATLFTSTSWSNNVSLAAAAQFSQNTTTSNPIPVFDTAGTTIIRNSGKRPSYGILPRDGFIASKNHVSVLDRIKHTSAELTQDMMAALFDLPELFVPIASHDTSAEGTTDAITSIFPDNAFVGWKPASAGMKTPSAGYHFMLAQPRVRRWRDEPRKGEMIEVEVQIDQKVVASLAGYLIIDLTA